MKKVFTIFSVAILAVTACQQPAEIIAPTSIELDMETETLMPGEYFDLGATVKPANATSNYIKWTSSDTKIATVTPYGQVAAIGPQYGTDKDGNYKMGVGKAVITATTADGKLAAQCTILVNPIHVTGIEVGKTINKVWTPLTESVVEPDALDTLEVKFTPANASYKYLAWSVNPEAKKIASVDKNGVVNGLDWGSATVSVKALDGEFSKDVAYTVKEVEPTEPVNLDIWKKDKASKKFTFGKTLSEKDVDWITFDNGTVSWTENTTGAPRTGTVKTTAGDVLTITQVDTLDFVGNFEMQSKSFKPSGNPAKTALSFAKAEEIETLEDADGVEHTNRYGVTGFYQNAVAGACVDINYGAKIVKVGIFCDARDNAQEVTAPEDPAYKYVAFLPEQGSTASFGGPYHFVMPDLDDTKDYCWIWISSEEGDFTNFTYNASTKPQYVKGNKVKDGENRIIGLTIAGFSSRKVNAKTQKGGDSDYLRIYQFNPITAASGENFSLTYKGKAE